MSGFKKILKELLSEAPAKPKTKSTAAKLPASTTVDAVFQKAPFASDPGGDNPIEYLSDDGRKAFKKLKAAIPSIELTDVLKPSFRSKMIKAFFGTPKKANDKDFSIYPDYSLDDFIDDVQMGLDDMYDSSGSLGLTFGYDPELNTPMESDLYGKLADWFGSSNNASANAFVKFMSVLQKAKKKWPKIFAPHVKPGGLVFRGTGISPTLQSKLRKLTTDDFQRVFCDSCYEDEYYVVRRPIVYTPKRNAQSFTSEPNAALEFNSQFMLVTRVNDEYFFNADVGDYFGFEEEEETIHVGMRFKDKVFLCVSSVWYDKYIAGNRNGPEMKKFVRGLYANKKKVTPIK